MTTRDQARWMELIEFLNSGEFDFTCAWFEDADGRQPTTMANRIDSDQHIPQDAKSLRIDGRIWVRSDDVIHQVIQNIYAKILTKSEYLARLVDDKLFIQLVPEIAD